MPYSCPICSDLLDRTPQDPTNTHGGNIACAPCGHFFHSFCIYKWIEGNLPTNKQCPCCRKPIPNKRCLPLFPTVHDDSFLDESINHNCNHEPVLNELRQKIKVLEKKKSDMEELNKTLREDIQREKQNLKNERSRNEQWQIKCARLSSFEDYSKQLEQRCQTAEAQIISLQKIQNVIDSVQTGVDMMGDYPVTKESVDTLKSMNAILTNELRASVSMTKSAQKQQEQLRQANSKSNHEIKALSAKNRSLENKIASLEIELEELRSINGINVDQSIIKVPTPKVTPARKRRGADITTLKEKKEKQSISDDSVIELTPERDDDLTSTTSTASSKLKIFNDRAGHDFGVSGSNSEKNLKLKTKSTSDLLGFGSSSSTARAANSYVNPLKRGLKVKKTAASTSDLLKGSAKSSSAAITSTSSSQPEGKVRQTKTASSDNDTLPHMSYSANLKSTLLGLPFTGTPVGTFSKLKTKDSKRIHGVPRAPKIIKK